MITEQGTEINSAAISYAQRGWSVFPTHSINGSGRCTCGKPECSNPGKHPATKRGFKDATSDLTEVAQFFNGKARNVAVATGAPSGFWILDLDGPQGIEHLDQLQTQHGSLPETVSVRTGGGGLHLFFRHSGTPIKTSNRIEGLAVDCRGDGGYAVLPPSRHASGKRYDWIVSPDDHPVADPPTWLVGFVNGNRTHDQPVSSGLSFEIGGVADGLATAPGAAKGKRHSDALRLIGSEIGRGTDPVTVANLAIAWGKRCSPPMADDEILRIVADLSRRDGTRISTVEAAVLDQPLPEPAPWPILDSDAYYGLAGEIVRRIEPETEADPVAILAQLLVSYGSMIGRDPRFVVEGTRHHCNLYAVLVGSTARGRKGTSEGRVRSILREVDQGWTDEAIKSGLVSGEGLIWNVRDAIYKLEAIRDKGKVVGTQEVLVDGGIIDKRLLCLETEFASVLRVCRRETNTLSAVLRAAWDSGHLRTLAKNSPAKATDAHVSLIGHITRDELTRTLADVDGFNGFANRFLWVAVRRSKLLPTGGADLDLTRLSQRLALTAEHARSVGRMHRDQSATALWHRIYTELADDNPGGLLAAVTSRAEAIVLRISMVYSLLDGSDTITEAHLRAALALWRYCRSSAEMIFGSLASDPVEDQILAAIRQQPGISRTDLHRILGGHVKAVALRSVLIRLRDAGTIRAEKTETGGRPAEQWFLATRQASPLADGPSPSVSCERSELSEERSVASPSAGPDQGLSGSSG